MAYSAESKEAYAQQMRDNPTASEAKLRDKLIKRGYHFEFQPVMLGYIPDFYFPTFRKIVELDGKQFHDPEKDAIRDGHFAQGGIATLRIQSSRVFSEMTKVMNAIDRFLGIANITTDNRAKRRHKAMKKAGRRERRRLKGLTPKGTIPNPPKRMLTGPKGNTR